MWNSLEVNNNRSAQEPFEGACTFPYKVKPAAPLVIVIYPNWLHLWWAGWIWSSRVGNLEDLQAAREITAVADKII